MALGGVSSRLAEHEAGAAGNLELLLAQGAVFERVTVPDSVSPEEALSLLVVALTRSHDWAAYTVSGQLVRRRLPYTLDDARLLVELTEQGRDDVWTGRLRARAALSALELRAAAGDDVAGLADRLLDVIVGPHHYQAAEWTKLAGRARKLTGATDDPQVVSAVLQSDDPWAEHVRPQAVAFASQGELLELLGSATQSRPTRRWLDTARPLLADDAPNLLRLLLESAADVPPRRLGSMVFEGREYVSYLWLSDMSATVVRGALWAASLVDGDDWVVATCERLIGRAQQTEQIKVGNACFYCLGERADDEAVALLGRLVTQLKDRRFLKPAQAALERAAEKRGVSGEQLREQLVPDFGLDVDGRGIREVGPAEVAVELAPPTGVKLRYRLDGRESASVPDALKTAHESELASLKRETADLRKELGSQRFRLEDLLASDRVWEYDEWRRCYLEHPLVQLFARRLIWVFDSQPALPLERNCFLALDSAVDPPAGGTVRLWHPLEASTDEIVGWRALLRERELRQPFKQAHREIYLLAPAERETAVYSNRFAAHIVRYPQVYALAKQRGWGVRALGPYDNGGGEQWREFAADGVRASFWMEMADDDFGGGPIAGLASTDQVRFTRIGERDPLPLEEIPPRVFSEAMRDVDLFVGVASIAADPTWIDTGPDRFRAYWHAHAFGGLGESALVRREVLVDLLPGLKIAERLELEERFLRVRGNLRTYRIHLGSGNVLVEPDDRYLCIVPARSASTGRLFLPFEDERLSVILSKAFLLAKDDEIDDPSIVRQLGRAV